MSHHHTHHGPERHPKTDFQVERLAFFSDAVFAIALTLLILELKVPEVRRDSTIAETWQLLLALWPGLMALMFSFALIGIYWWRHHRLFRQVDGYNGEIVAANMFFLLPIIFFPFSMSFFIQCLDKGVVLMLALRVFAFNQIFASLTFYLLYWLVTHRHRHLSIGHPDDDMTGFGRSILMQAVTFAALFAGTFFTGSLYYIVYGTILVRLSGRIAARFGKKKS